VLSSYLHLYTNAGPDGWPFVREDDRFLVNMPIFHIGGTGLPFTMLARGGSIALMENFSTETFWTMVRQTRCTVICLLGVMATFLLKREPSADDLDHSVRLAFMVPLTENAGEFRSRFGIDVYSIFNMTEVSTPTFTQANPAKLGTCGRPRPGVDVRLVDENDCEVAIGEVGEMIVRTDRPWGMNSGYYKNPEATAKAWRNGWFHTGDAFRRDAEGDFYFVDRMMTRSAGAARTSRLSRWRARSWRTLRFAKPPPSGSPAPIRKTRSWSWSRRSRGMRSTLPNSLNSLPRACPISWSPAIFGRSPNCPRRRPPRCKRQNIAETITRICLLSDPLCSFW
jgi:acyl-CoA synthetase (AMP-forming)/AMP-acid ligase II